MVNLEQLNCSVFLDRYHLALEIGNFLISSFIAFICVIQAEWLMHPTCGGGEWIKSGCKELNLFAVSISSFNVLVK